MLGEVLQEGRWRIHHGGPGPDRYGTGLWGWVVKAQLEGQLLYLREGISPVMGGSFSMPGGDRLALKWGHMPEGWESVLELCVPNVRSARFAVQSDFEQAWRDLEAAITAADPQHRRTSGRAGFTAAWAEALLAGEKQLRCGHLKSQPSDNPHRPHAYHPSCTYCGDVIYACVGCVSQGPRVCHSECFDLQGRQPLPRGAPLGLAAYLPRDRASSPAPAGRGNQVLDESVLRASPEELRQLQLAL